MGLVNGLPVGLTIAGPANSESTLLALGLLLEQNLGCRSEDGFKPTFIKAD
jgi:Asp-tRNA(Asn)/Glu-tRNA(Gln) amidotransferase A subunit family amidase